jgi:TolB-like protein/DNA-binding winged helix-turn-helix (wHTH) protein/Tfp pilus assembly protein PilF
MAGTASKSPARYEFGDLILDIGQSRVLRGRESLNVAGLTFGLLRVLVESAPNVVSHDELAEKVWGGRFVSPETISQRALMLRHALDDDADHPSYFETIRGQGYRLIPVVKPLSGTPGAISKRRFQLVAATAAALAILFSPIGWRAFKTSRDDLSKSVAVLPFENLSLDPENAFFAAGVHEEVLNQLAKLRDLRLISRTSVLRYADSDLSIPEIARALNVGVVMEGSVRYTDDRIRITTQLIDAVTDEQLWSETYEREFVDIFAIEIDIAVKIADALQTELSLAEQATIEKVPTSSPEAYELFLRALSLQQIDTPRAVSLLSGAIAIDPDFGLAHAYRALFNSSLLINTTSQTGPSDPINQFELEATIRRDAQRALVIDSNLSPAYTGLARIYVYSWRWTEARQAFQRALESPAPVEVSSLLRTYAWFNAWDGQPDEAITLSRAALELDPGLSAAYRHLGLAHAFNGNAEAALTSLYQSVELDRAHGLGHQWVALMSLVLGDKEEALSRLRLTERLYAGSPPIILLPTLAYAHGLLGRSGDASRLFAEFARRSTERSVGTGSWVTAYLAIRDRESALEWLNHAVEGARNNEIDASFLNLMNIKLNVFDDPILEEPAFVELRNELAGR